MEAGSETWVNRLLPLFQESIRKEKMKNPQTQVQLLWAQGGRDNGFLPQKSHYKWCFLEETVADFTFLNRSVQDMLPWAMTYREEITPSHHRFIGEILQWCCMLKRLCDELASMMYSLGHFKLACQVLSYCKHLNEQDRETEFMGKSHDCY